MTAPERPNSSTDASPSRSGAFAANVDQRVEKFGESISFDWQLYRHDIEASMVHARMLARQNLISSEEQAAICQGLLDIRGEIERGNFQWRQELEDVHMNIEQALIDRLGDTGRKLHTARSRNDQVTTDLRLWTRGRHRPHGCWHPEFAAGFCRSV